MLLRTLVLRKTKKPLHTHPRPHRVVDYVPKFTCNRHPYHAASSVCSLLCPLLSTTQDSHSFSHPHKHLASPAASHTQYVEQLALTEMRHLLDGAPTSLECCGPLPKDLLQGIARYLSNTAVLRLLEDKAAAGITATTTESTLLRSLWPQPLREAYGAAIVDERMRHLSRKKQGVLEPRFEAGVISRSFFSKELHTPTGVNVRELGAASVSEADEHSLLHHWYRLVDAYTLPFPDRSNLHELENLPQEIGLGELLAETAHSFPDTPASQEAPSRSFDKRSVECIVDIGGGNGFLTAALSERIGCRGVVVDPYYPPHSIDCLPSPWQDTRQRERPPHMRRSQITRVTKFLRDLQWASDVGSDPTRTAVVAKHLCGSGIDECLTALEAQGTLPSVLVLAPCCLSKIHLASYCNPYFLQKILGITTQVGFDRIGALSDWNMSAAQFAQEATLEQRTKQRRRVAVSEAASEQETSFPFRRVGAYRSVAALVPCMHGISQLVEAIVTMGRVKWLQERGYTTQFVQYVPHEVTPKCKCLVAVRQ